MTSNDAETAETLKAGFLATVPFARTLGLRFEELEPGRSVMRLPDEPAHHNHIGGPHAGAMFTLAESASGSIILSTFSDQLDRAVPLPTTVTQTFEKVAMGDMVAEARLGRPREEIVAELDAGKRPEFPVEVELRTEDGTVTGHVTVVWTLKPKRRD
ncbi:DUF4442 domain-containing protein [Nocardiopsis chromatogenes]|uniref:DUF4442 domain-containing protein n=1 Tax=Nocardiopsis chromatogenes TaxID=280239 RepID=UPI00034B36BE|nr:DUF4442 domain-containing protein [Nocardiopsis chromatogenes]